METSNLACIIHYKVKDTKYSELKPISNVNQKQIFEARLLRKKKGGINQHEELYCLVPEEIDHLDLINRVSNANRWKKKMYSTLISTTTKQKISISYNMLFL